MENIVYFEIKKKLNNTDETITIRKFFDLTTEELVDYDDNDTCNFVALPTKMEVICVEFCTQ